MEPVFFLDFDGVICDSVDECFVSSWIAYHELFGGEPAMVALSYYRRFRALRPYIRTGADYVYIHRVLSGDEAAGSQEDFDRGLSSLGEQELRRFHQAFYSVRERLLRSEREWWIGLNRIYPGIHEMLPRIDGCSYIVTTKEVSFAAEILASAGSDWRIDRIYCSGRQRKIPFIRGIMDERGIESAVFVDDQIDHLSRESDDQIDVYLAEWGYVQPEWLEQQEVPRISRSGFVDMLCRFF